MALPQRVPVGPVGEQLIIHITISKLHFLLSTNTLGSKKKKKNQCAKSYSITYGWQWPRQGVS